MNRRDLMWAAALAVLAVGAGAAATGATVSGVSTAAVVAVAGGVAFVVRPEWFVLTVLALPGGLLERSAPATALALAGIVVALRVVATIDMPRFSTALTPLACLVGLAYVHRAPVDAPAAAAAGEFRLQLIYYLSLAVIAYGCVRRQRLSPHQIMLAAVAGAVGGAVIYAAQVVLTGVPILMSADGAAGNPGLLFYRTHFGYLMCIGLAASFELRTSLSDRTKRRLVDAVIAGLMLMVLVSMTRSAWLIAVIVAAASWSRRTHSNSVRWSRAAAALVAAALVGVLLFEAVPLVRERLSSDVESGLSESIESGTIGSGRLYLWRELILEGSGGGLAGNGFGHMWSLDPIDVFGTEQYTVEENPFIYAHNDALYLFVDLGVTGVLLWLAFWVALLRARFRAVENRHGAWPAKFVDGVIVTMLIAELVDNGLFIQALSEPFFVCVGLVLARAAARPRAASSMPDVARARDVELARG